MASWSREKWSVLVEPSLAEERFFFFYSSFFLFQSLIAREVYGVDSQLGWGVVFFRTSREENVQLQSWECEWVTLLFDFSYSAAVLSSHSIPLHSLVIFFLVKEEKCRYSELRSSWVASCGVARLDLEENSIGVRSSGGREMRRQQGESASDAAAFQCLTSGMFPVISRNAVRNVRKTNDETNY